MADTNTNPTRGSGSRGRGAQKASRPAAPTKREPTGAEAALASAFAVQRRTILTRDVFLRSQGPKVIEVELPMMAVTVLMRRVNLLDLARRGVDYYPFRNAIYSMVRENKITDAQMAVDGFADTMDLAIRIALDTIVVPPPEYIEAAARDDEEYEPVLAAWQAEFEQALADSDAARIRELSLARPERPTTHTASVLTSLDPSALRPFFVEEGEEADDDQVVLRLALPDDDGRVGESSPAEGDADGVDPVDLVTILREVGRYGPGAMGRRFRGDEPSSPAVAPLLHLANGRAKA